MGRKTRMLIGATAAALLLSGSYLQQQNDAAAAQTASQTPASVCIIQAAQRNLTPLNGKPERLRDTYSDRVYTDFDSREMPAPPELPYTEQELEWLALVIYQEAGADFCSDDTRLKVGTVVMNRVADDRFPDTIEGVLLQKAQYGRLHWTGLVWPERASTEAEAAAVERAYDCARRLLMGERFLPEDTVFQAEFVQGFAVVCYQDGVYFCRG